MSTLFRVAIVAIYHQDEWPQNLYLFLGRNHQLILDDGHLSLVVRREPSQVQKWLNVLDKKKFHLSRLNRWQRLQTQLIHHYLLLQMKKVPNEN